MTNQTPTLVLGGLGKTGSRVASRLATLGQPVRIGSRAGSPRFDWDDRSTWRPALDGVRAAYITYQPDVAMPGASDAIASFVGEAMDGGVRRLVLLSGRGEPEAELAEGALIRSGADWTVIRSSFFDQNFSEGFLLDMVLAGEIVLPVGDIGEPFIDADDIADVAVAALTDDRHIGELYEVTGPRLLSFADALDTIGRAAGRRIAFTTISRGAFQQGLVDEQVPADYAWLFDYLFNTVLDGRNARVADGVQRALGREPRDFLSYVNATALTGVWHDAQSHAA